MPQLFVLSGSSVGRSFEVGIGATIGRSPDSTIVLKDRSISRQHAHLEQTQEGTWELVDDGSRNGIAIGEDKHERVALPDGQEFLCGEVLMRFRTAVAAPEDVAPALPATQPSEEPELDLQLEDEDEPDLELSEGGGFVAPRGPAPAIPADPEGAEDEDEGGIDFEDADDIDLAAGDEAGEGLEQTMVNPRVAPPAPVSPDAKKVGLGPPSRERLAEQRGRVLQYSRVAESDSLLSFELSQLPAWKRYALYLGAVLVLAGVFAVTVFGTSFLKGKVAGPSQVESTSPGD